MENKVKIISKTALPSTYVTGVVQAWAKKQKAPLLHLLTANRPDPVARARAVVDICLEVFPVPDNRTGGRKSLRSISIEKLVERLEAARLKYPECTSRINHHGPEIEPDDTQLSVTFASIETEAEHKARIKILERLEAAATRRREAALLGKQRKVNGVKAQAVKEVKALIKAHNLLLPDLVDKPVKKSSAKKPVHHLLPAPE